MNGELRVGDWVISTPYGAYGCLVGTVLELVKLGTPQHETESENMTDDVHINFASANYSDRRITEILATFSEIYGRKIAFGECPLDDTILAPDNLIRITGINAGKLEYLLYSYSNAATFCKSSAQVQKLAEPLHYYNVAITETRSIYDGIAAFDKEDAERIAKDNWENSAYILDSADYLERLEFEAEDTELETEKGKIMNYRPNLYTVTITETLSKEVEVEAASQDEAELLVKANWRSGDYILDAENFVDVEFEARPTEPEAERGQVMNDKIMVLLVEPMMTPKVVEMDNTLKAMQQAVGGDIEVVHTFDDNVALVCNEEGKLMGLQPNRGLYDDVGQLKDVLVGNFFLCGDGGENFASLTSAQFEKYTALFAQPQDFVFQNGRIVPVPAQVAPPKAESAPPAFKRPAAQKSKPSRNRGGNAR